MRLIDRAIYKFFKAERTYSQAGEDRLLSFLFNSFDKSKISYLDIGTNHPFMGNNTYLFYRNGGSGVCVEPNSELSKLIRKLRPRDTCLNIGVGERENDVVDFYLMSSHGLSTFSKEDAEELDAAGKYKIKDVQKIPVRTVNSIIEENFDVPIDLVSIDVEGWNEEIVRSFDFSKNRPFCFCVETITFSEDHTERKLTDIFDVFAKNDYSVYADTHLNTIFLRNDSMRK
ncbi:MAG: FkbM family methyltransferase [Pyrinomonadaceae bacterium]|nr:FkbM family methyltransferase [Pyrinomonadaceae bacterium]